MPQLKPFAPLRAPATPPHHSGRFEDGYFDSRQVAAFVTPSARSVAGRCPDLPGHAAITTRSASGFGVVQNLRVPGQVELIQRKETYFGPTPKNRGPRINETSVSISSEMVPPIANRPAQRGRDPAINAYSHSVAQLSLGRYERYDSRCLAGSPGRRASWPPCGPWRRETGPQVCPEDNDSARLEEIECRGRRVEVRETEERGRRSGRRYAMQRHFVSRNAAIDVLFRLLEGDLRGHQM